MNLNVSYNSILRVLFYKKFRNFCDLHNLSTSFKNTAGKIKIACWLKNT